ncbi:MAG: hypothetical protein Q8S17_10795, partial [Humidesulfovibrio sp.]|nr:hypothetical protein [Humidesulfovibrio sp.]
NSGLPAGEEEKDSMNARTVNFVIALWSLALLSGCGLEPPRPALDATWGLSVRMAVENQKLDPTLASDRAVAGLDGVYAKNALEAYRKSSEADPQGGKDKQPEAVLFSKKEGK